MKIGNCLYLYVLLLLFDPLILSTPKSSIPSIIIRHRDIHHQSIWANDQRAGGLDSNPSTTSSALSIIQPPSPTQSFPPQTPRWEPLSTELWLGGMERYNSRLEGYEAMTALEVIEHLDPHILSRFGVVTMGTYRPRILLVTTPVSFSSPLSLLNLVLPSYLLCSSTFTYCASTHSHCQLRCPTLADDQNFDFNAKFPRNGHDEPRKGFVDPTGRTERVFRYVKQARPSGHPIPTGRPIVALIDRMLTSRHSDHKLEMTHAEFVEWATSSAADWG